MLESERKKLFDPEREYANIGISEGGVCYSITPIVWETTASAFNTRTPDIYIAPEDLKDEEIWGRICSLVIRGLYIYVPLEDYSFISKLTTIWDLHIRDGENIKNLDFLSGVPECMMLFLCNATLDNVDIIWEMKKTCKGFISPYSRLGLYDCKVNRAPDPEDLMLRFTEFLVWSRPENRASDMEKWRAVPGFTKKYFTIKQED